MSIGAGAVGLGSRPAPAQGGPRIRRYVRLGATDMEISDISFGSSRMSDPDLVRHGLDRGINYFDTAESYRWGGAEEAIGEALRGVRDRVFIASKTKAGASESRKSIMSSLEGTLRRLQTDYVDVYFNHAINDVDRMKNQEWWEFTELAKRQGKIRYRGMSGHGSRLVESLEYAVDNDLADVVLVAYSFAQDPDIASKVRHLFHYVAIQDRLPPVLEKAKAKNIGVIAMKVLMGARLNDMRPYETPETTFAQAAFRWVADSPLVDGLIISMTERSQLDEYVSASGSLHLSSRDRRDDRKMLERYLALNGARYCRHGCNACEGSCPHQVPIAEVLRTRMYALDYGDPELARHDYARLESNATACLDCGHRSCLGACPIGIPIAHLTRDAALRLG